MTKEEMRIAIAKDQGWHRRPNEATTWFNHNGSKTTVLPNYPEDLNAMHEVEKTLTRYQGVKLRALLASNSDGKRATYQTVEAAMCHATAEERAKAVCKVKGLWKE